MVLLFVPIPIAALVLLAVQSRTRQRGEDLPLAAAIGTGVLLGFVAVEAGLTLMASVTGLASDALG